MKKKLFSLLLTAALLLGLAVPVMAEEAEPYTDPDGILTIELPDENWKEIQDPSKWLVFSDGANMITIDHYSNGEKLPEFEVADEHYVNTLMAAYSTQNEVFICSGYLKDEKAMEAVNKAMFSIKIKKYDTKKAVGNNVSTGEFKIEPRDMTMYVNVADSLTVRNGFSIDSKMIGSLANGTAVHVTGVVQRGGKDYGWYQISYNNSTGYVSADYLVADPPADGATPTSTSDEEQNFTYLVYDQSTGRAVNITGNRGIYYDGYGNMYYQVGSAHAANFVDDYNNYYTTTAPNGAGNSQVIGLISDGSGRPVAIVDNGNGSFTDDEGNYYYQKDDGTWYDDNEATYQVNYDSELQIDDD